MNFVCDFICCPLFFHFLNTAVKAHYRGKGTSPEHFIYSKCNGWIKAKGLIIQLDLCYLCIVDVKYPGSLAGDSRICLSQLTIG